MEYLGNNFCKYLKNLSISHQTLLREDESIINDVTWVRVHFDWQLLGYLSWR